MAYTQSGPFPVGVTTLTLAKGNKVEVWYPAVAGTTGEVTYDVRDFVPDAIRKILTADIPATYSFAGARDPDAAGGAFPVVLFSHGFTGIRLQSTFLTAHLATWGMIVAAPDHPSRDLTNVLAGTASGSTADSVDDLLKTLELIISENTSAPSKLNGRVDTAHVIAVGHSAGGGTVVGAALDPRIAGYVSLASGVEVGRGSTPPTTTAETGPATSAVAPSAAPTTGVPVPLPDKPSFFMAGALDAVVPAQTVTVPSFQEVPTPSRLWIIDGVGHNGFDDFCTFGNGTGIIGVADASGLSAVLDAQPQLRKLGTDGCVAPDVPVAQTFPIIRHAVTAWLRNEFGIDAAPIGLGAEVASAYPARVTIEQRL